MCPSDRRSNLPLHSSWAVPAKSPSAPRRASKDVRRCRVGARAEPACRPRPPAARLPRPHRARTPPPQVGLAGFFLIILVAKLMTKKSGPQRLRSRRRAPQNPRRRGPPRSPFPRPFPSSHGQRRPARRRPALRRSSRSTSPWAPSVSSEFVRRCRRRRHPHFRSGPAPTLLALQTRRTVGGRRGNERRRRRSSPPTREATVRASKPDPAPPEPAQPSSARTHLPADGGASAGRSQTQSRNVGLRRRAHRAASPPLCFLFVNVHPAEPAEVRCGV